MLDEQTLGRHNDDTRRKEKKRERAVRKYKRNLVRALEYFDGLNGGISMSGGGCETISMPGVEYDWTSNYYMLGVAIYGGILAAIPVLGSAAAATTALGGATVYSVNWWIDGFCNSAETQLFKIVPGIGELMEQGCGWFNDYRDAYIRQVRSMIAAILYGEAAILGAVATSDSAFLPLRVLRQLAASQAQIVCFFSRRAEELHLLLKKHRQRLDNKTKTNQAASTK